MPERVPPIAVCTLIDVYTTRNTNITSGVHREWVDRLVVDNIIVPTPNGYQLTSKGKAWLYAMLATPYPTQLWIDSNGKVININE